ncbi:MAG: hypothetical protein JRF63_02820 [Deltaproteobacteria bacterium]|nr:hypothetical protein [Deltaproteobacteria bacterium]
MAGKKKGKTKSGKRVTRRVGEGEEPKPTKTKQKAAPVEKEEKPRINERLQEKDAGFGVIKVVIGVIVVLILAAGAFSRIFGDEESVRGDGDQDELCESTPECAKGLRCFAYGDEKRRCLKTCPGGEKCETGYTCVSAAERSGRKKTAVRAVCVKDAEVLPSDQ